MNRCILLLCVTFLGKVSLLQVAVTGYNDKLAVFDVLEEEPWFEFAWEAPVIPNQTWMQVVNGITYATNEIGEWNGVEGGVLSAWKYNNEEGTLEQTQAVSLPSIYPAHLLIDESKGKAYAAHYGGSSFVALEYSKESGIGEVVYKETYQNCRDDSHPHEIVAFQDWLWVVDLGCDALWQYRVTDTIEMVGMTPITAGAGPRHMIIIEERNLAVLLCELKSIVELFKLNPSDGSLQSLQQLPLASIEGNSGAEILIGPNRNYIYASSRGSGVLVVYKLSSEEDSLERLQELRIGGSWPRSMVIKDNMILVASKWENSLERFNINPDTGLLEVPSNNMVTNTPEQPAFIMLWEM